MEINEKKKKAQIAKISVFTTSIFVIFLSITYAFINMTVTGTKRQVITSGNLDLVLDEDENNLQITNAMPMYDEVGMLQDAFTFRLINKAGADVKYALKLEEIQAEDGLAREDVKYGLTKDETTYIDLTSNIIDDVIDEGTIKGNQTIEYSLRLWINEDVTDSSRIFNKSIRFRVSVMANQAKVVGDPILQKRENYNSKEFFWGEASNITSIAIENEINVPSGIAADKKWDVSAANDESVMAYIEPDSEGSSTYKLHIQGKDKVIANVDSSNLFYGFSNLVTLEGLENLDTSNVINMRSLFDGCSKLANLDLKDLDTSNVENMGLMFNGCSSLVSLDLSSFNTQNVTNMYRMFALCDKLQSLDISIFNTSNVTDMSSMFFRCNGLVSLDLSNFDTANVTDMSGMFQSCGKLQSLNISSFDTSNVVNMQGMFIALVKMTSLDLGNFNTSKVEDMSYLFSTCWELTSVNLSSFNTTNVTRMDHMFEECKKLSSIVLNNFDTSNVTRMDSMFQKCETLTSLDLSKFNTEKLVNMDSMFYNCSSLKTINLSSFNTSNTERMGMVFRGCSSLTTLDLKNFVTTKVTVLSDMFDNCSSLTSLDIRNFDTTNIGYLNSNFDSVNTSCRITVKNAAMKTWVQGENSSLTNFSIQSS